MAEIRAFVGHSFAESDQELVIKFTRYLSTISELNIGFSWEHAEQAEPKIVSAKVIELLKDKNTFIGICTKKEMVISEQNLKSKFWDRKLLFAESQHFEWKTSDWVIQEIGLAIGRDLKIILLVEEGLRSPGSLQDNLEYISFERDSPEKSFGKILQMIKSLTPSVVTHGNILTQPPQELSKEPKPPSKLEKSSFLIPKKTWDKKDYDFAIYLALTRNLDEDFRKISQSYKKSIHNNGLTFDREWESSIELNRVLANRNGSLEKLKKFADELPLSSTCISNLANGYAATTFNAKAAETFLVASKATEDSIDSLKYKLRAVTQFGVAGMKIEANSVFASINENFNSATIDEMEYLETLDTVSEIFKEDVVRTASMERMLEISPQNDDLRFRLAYLYGEIGRNEFALHHYSEINPKNRSGTVWNNLGVAYGNLDTPAKSIAAFEAAAEKDHSLARSNLALKYLNAGFVKEAHQQILNARKLEDYHKNVDTTLVQLKAIDEEEETKIKIVREKTRPIIDFYRAAGRSVSSRLFEDLLGSWQGPDCKLNVVKVGETFRATGEFQEISSSPLGGLFQGLGGTGSQGTSYTKQVVYEGNIRGRMIVGKVSRTDVKPPIFVNTLLGRSNETEVLMYVSDTADKISILEGMNKLYSLVRI